MKTEYIKLIQEHDKTLSLLREEWMKASDKDKKKWFDKIDSSLDERSRLMKIRDSK